MACGGVSDMGWECIRCCVLRGGVCLITCSLVGACSLSVSWCV